MADDSNKIKALAIGAVILISLSAVVLTGLALVSEFSKILRVDTTVNQSTSSIVLTASNDTADIVGTSGQFPFLQDLTGCANATDLSETFTKNTDYTITEGDVNGGFFLLTGNKGIGDNINCSAVSYLADSVAQASADQFVTGLGVFATFSAIVAIALIGKVVISIFSKKGF